MCYNTNNTSNNHNNNTTPSYGSSGQHNSNNSGYGYSKSNQQEKPVNVSVTLHRPVSKDQLYKIQEVLRHPSQYRDRIKPEDHPVKGEYATAFNKFLPKKVEVNEATVKEAIKYGQFLKKSKEDIAKAIDLWSRRRSRVPTGTTTTMTTSQVCSTAQVLHQLCKVLLLLAIWWSCCFLCGLLFLCICARGFYCSSYALNFWGMV